MSSKTDAGSHPVIIIGAGVVGLALAHGLKKAGIPFQVFERDESADLRSQGWAITIHWALPFLREILDQDILSAIDGVQVDAAAARHDNGNFVFLNLETLEAKFRIPPSERRRLDRNKLRNVLVNGIADHIHWGKRLVDIQVTGPGNVDGESGLETVAALFADGTRATGTMVIGADGTNSATRRFLVPDHYQNHELPVRMLGTAVKMTPAQAKPLHDIDPLLFQGCHPKTGVFLWASTLSTPETNGTLGTADEHYLTQVMVSWMAKEGDEPLPSANADMVALMQRLAAGLHPTLRTVIDGISPSHEVSSIALKDWPSHPWDNRNGSVTLAGDAAHAMTMYRGEACNHGILDARNLLRVLLAVPECVGEMSPEKARMRREMLDAYEKEVQERGVWAVLLSREACLGAHDFDGLNENSAVLKRRTFTT